MEVQQCGRSAVVVHHHVDFGFVVHMGSAVALFSVCVSWMTPRAKDVSGKSDSVLIDKGAVVPGSRLFSSLYSM